MVKTPLFPEYNKVRALIKILNGLETDLYYNMWAQIWNATGTPQNPVNWKEPDVWIPQRLEKKEASLAFKIWTESKKNVNPRHVRGLKFLIDNYTLLKNVNGKFELTAHGKDFLTAESKTVQNIDMEEGCSFILSLVSVRTVSKRADLYPEWKEYLLNHSNNRTVSVINDSLSKRLKNLVQRKIIVRNGNQYSITNKGKKYLEVFDAHQPIKELTEETKINQMIDEYNNTQRVQLMTELKTMDPFDFEHVIKELLDKMGYDDVEVTSKSNDKGVDVIGIIQKGISAVKDVIQVKRNTRTNIGRRVLDELRGSLHRFQAFQGTVITTLDFSSGAKKSAFESGGAPITLINGETLLDLLIEYEIGIKEKNKISLLSVDHDFFESIAQNRDKV